MQNLYLYHNPPPLTPKQKGNVTEIQMVILYTHRIKKMSTVRKKSKLKLALI